MPITPSYNSVIEIQLRMRMDGQVLMNVGHFTVVPSTAGLYADGFAALDDLVGQFDNIGVGITNQMASYLNVALEFEQIRAQFISPFRYAYKSFLPAATVGTQVTDPAPQNVTGVITLQTDYPGRHNRGDKFIPGLQAVDVVGGFVSGLQRSHMEATGVFWRGPYTLLSEGIDVQGIILNRDTPADSKYITHLVSQPESRVMRRRTVGRGI